MNDVLRKERGVRGARQEGAAKEKEFQDLDGAV